jgi:hypothetical protein
MLTISRRLAVLLLTSSLLAASVAAATISADDLDNIVFEGTLRDSAGAVVSEAKISASHTGTGVTRTVLSNGEGRYRIAVNKPGTYRLKATADGFKDQETAEIVTTTGRSFTLDFDLTAAGAAEQVAVSGASPPLIDTSRTVVGDTVTQRDLEELPIISRDPLQLIFLLGGVTEAPLSTSQLADEGRGVFLRGTPEEAGNFSLTGAPATSNNITIDGLDNNDDRTARGRISLNAESIAELQVITNQYAAEYGRASGGRINIQTKTGTNRYRRRRLFLLRRRIAQREHVLPKRARAGAPSSTAAPGGRSLFRPDFQKKGFLFRQLRAARCDRLRRDQCTRADQHQSAISSSEA